MPLRATTAADTIRQCVETFNQCTTDWVDRYYAASVEWIELATRANPRGRRGDREALRSAAQAALALCPDRQMSIRSLVADGQHVAVELGWHGTMNRAMGDVGAGTVIEARIASFFTVVEGLIVEHTDYCVPAVPE